MDDLTQLKNYQYKGTDNSIISKYCLTPFYNYIITFIPHYVSPNFLTLIGFLCSLTAFILTLSTDFTLNSQQNKYIFLINAILIFIYQTFDAIDGKQARKLNISSPLGQMFDHGCDLFVSVFICTSLASALKFGLGYNYLFTLLTFLTVYYVCCVEEYFLNEFYLGYVNGPSEGILAAVLVHIGVFIVGPDNIKPFYEFRIWILPFPIFICLFLIFGTFLFSFVNIIVYRKHGSKMDVINMLASGYLVLVNTVMNSFHKMLSGNKEKYFLIVMCTIVLGRLTIDILYAHLKRSKVGKNCSVYKVYVYGSPILLVSRINYFILFMVFVWAVYCYLERIMHIKNEMCEYLEISFFKVKEKSKKE